MPRAGVSFTNTITAAGQDRDRSIPRPGPWSSPLPDGRLVNLPVADSVSNLAAIHDGSTANVTYTEVVTMLNLRQKGPGSREARRDR